VLESSK